MAEATTRTLIQVDPRELLIDRNIRKISGESKEDQDLIESLKTDGQLQAIVAVRTAEGQLRVRFGERRTVCGIAAGLALMDVDVIGDESTDTAEEIDRIAGQYAENERRVALTLVEKAQAVDQLALLGMSAAAIGKRLRLPRADVKNARAIAGSELAKAATEKYELDLVQGAALVEFQDDPEKVKALVVAAKRGQFEHVVSRFRQDAADEIAQREGNEALAAEGHRVVAGADHSGGVRALWRLEQYSDGKMTAETHADCPGAVAWMEVGHVRVTADGTVLDPDDDHPDEVWAKAKSERRWVQQFGCDRAAELHPEPSDVRERKANGGQSDKEKDTARLERRRVIEGNKAWDAAVPVRREWLQEFMKRKTAPAGTGQFIAEAFIRGDHAIRRSFEGNHRLGVDLFGVEGKAEADAEARPYGPTRTDDLLTLVDGASDKRLSLVTLGLLLAAYEDGLHRMVWRGDHGPEHGRYLRFLANHGYVLSDVERLAAGIEVEASADEEAEG